MHPHKTHEQTARCRSASLKPSIPFLAARPHTEAALGGAASKVLPVGRQRPTEGVWGLGGLMTRVRIPEKTEASCWTACNLKELLYRPKCRQVKLKDFVPKFQPEALLFPVSSVESSTRLMLRCRGGLEVPCRTMCGWGSVLVSLCKTIGLRSIMLENQR